MGGAHAPLELERLPAALRRQGLHQGGALPDVRELQVGRASPVRGGGQPRSVRCSLRRRACKSTSRPSREHTLGRCASAWYRGYQSFSLTLLLRYESVCHAVISMWRFVDAPFPGLKLCFL